ncbi:hypothetical protein ACH5RR_001339 [Cinchona calisaya]|uniref:Reverse transcriptase zinc-binding domain-containing protein n=1 Tax=Cinchona calisaya TaxID=153742 RepID=A0ABD3B3S7_9GENT
MLATKDRLCEWGITTEVKCNLCYSENETMEHLFFKYGYTGYIWERLQQYCKLCRGNSGWHEELEWLAKHLKKDDFINQIKKIVLGFAVYSIWKERNKSQFQSTMKATDT